MSKKTICVWQEDEDYAWAFWQTDCDHSFQFTEGGTPADNEFAFCPYCGKILSAKELANAITDAG